MNRVTMAGVYVLELRNGAFYVGSSADVSMRVQEQEQGGKRSAAYVRACGGVKRAIAPITPPSTDLQEWERQETLLRMVKHGCNGVRGWEFSSLDLSSSQRQTIKTLLCGSTTGLCRNCGREGHYAKTCRTRSKAAWLQDLESSNAPPPDFAAVLRSALSAAEHVRRDCDLQPAKPAPPVQAAPPSRKRKACQRCGRSGHQAQSCYARTHFSGAAFVEESAESDVESSSTESEGGACVRCGRRGHFVADCYARTHAAGHALR